LGRLGCAAALEALLPLRGPADRFSHLSLDLLAGAAARVKVYVKHFDLRFGDLDRLESAISGGPRAEWGDFARELLGAHAQPLSARPIYTAYAIMSGRPDLLDGGTVQLPLLPYVTCDRDAYARILGVLERHELPSDGYQRAVEAMRRAPLAREQGLHSHVSFSRQAGSPRVAVYFGSRLYVDRYGWLSLDPVRSLPENCWPSPSVRRLPDER
jgi:hypothetical protein